MLLRRATSADLDAIRQLYYDTITTVNTADYDPQQIASWAANHANLPRWQAVLAEQDFFIAELDEKIVGFSSITSAGYLDLMFVHRDYQRRGIARQLLAAVETVAAARKLPKIWAEVSITARPFFAVHGYTITERFVKTVNGVSFDDAVMTKLLDSATSSI
jgi:putative acetyltransferase